MFKDFITKFSKDMKDEKEENLRKQGSTMGLEFIYMDDNNNLFKGRYLGVVSFVNERRYKYEVDGGFLLLDKPATQHRGVMGMLNTSLTYNNRSQIQRVNVSNGISSN